MENLKDDIKQKRYTNKDKAIFSHNEHEKENEPKDIFENLMDVTKNNHKKNNIIIHNHNDNNNNNTNIIDIYFSLFHKNIINAILKNL